MATVTNTATTGVQPLETVLTVEVVGKLEPEGTTLAQQLHQDMGKNAQVPREITTLWEVSEFGGQLPLHLCPELQDMPADSGAEQSRPRYRTPANDLRMPVPSSFLDDRWGLATSRPASGPREGSTEDMRKIIPARVSLAYEVCNTSR